MNYPVVIHKDRNSDYGVTVPDLPGCFTARRTVDEALALAKEAIELHVRGLIEEGDVVPEPRLVETHQTNEDFRGGIWAIVEVSRGALEAHARRINITMPERLLCKVDRMAMGRGDTRSGLLAKAAAMYVSTLPSVAAAPRWKRTVGHGAKRRGS